MDRAGLLFIVIWIQPIFWMVLFNFKTDKLDRLFKPFAICLVVVVIAGFASSVNVPIRSIYTTVRLMLLYSILGCVFTWYLMDTKKWHLPQALSISALAVFIGSFYWETPYLIRNAILTGFEWDWLLHIMVVFLVWYIRDSVGWCPDRRKLVYLTSIGLVISMIVMIIDPIPPGATANWNAPHYLLNRAVCSIIIFILINKDNVEGVGSTVMGGLREGQK